MSNHITYAFLLSTIAGLSTVLGSIIIFLKNSNPHKTINAALSFAAAVMITISITDLIPEAMDQLKQTYQITPCIFLLLISINIGIIISMLIDKYLPEQQTSIKNKRLYRIGIISMLAIILHNIPEGMATFITSSTNITLGISLTLAIACHNIPEGISISIPIYYSTHSKRKAISYTFLSGLSELLGAILAYLFLSPFINNIIMGTLFAIIAGIMLHIACYELLPTAKKYNESKTTIIFFLIGVGFMLLNHIIL